jgi:hypothetical protein
MNDKEQKIIDKKEKLEATLSKISGFPIEITIRGEHGFTLSAEGEHDFAKAIKFLKQDKRAEDFQVTYDKDIDFSCCFFKVKA